jgi:cysteine-S-conjugate beta-lyase
VEHPLRQLTLDELRTRTSVKWRVHPEDVLPLWVAEMDVLLAAPIVEAVIDAVARGDTGYAYGGGYAEALAGFASRRWGWELPVDRTRIVPDVMLGSVAVLRLVTDRGDGVVVNPPVYPPFTAFIEQAERRVVEAPLGPDGRLELGQLEAAFARPDTTAYLLCSPHNPTGAVHTADELRAVATAADRHGVRVLADEIHAPVVLSGDPGFVPYLSLPETQRGFALLSGSKAWNLAGLKGALVVAGEEAADDLARLPEEVGHGASHVGVLANAAAFAAGDRWLDGLLADLDENRRLLTALLAEHLPAVRYRPGEGTYLAWLDCRGLDLGDDPAATFLDRGRVALTGGLPFGPGGAGHVRLNLATTPAILTEAVERMVRACGR